MVSGWKIIHSFDDLPASKTVLNLGTVGRPLLSAEGERECVARGIVYTGVSVVTCAKAMVEKKLAW